LVHATENPSAGKNQPLEQDMLNLKLTKWGIPTNPGALICKHALPALSKGYLAAMTQLKSVPENSNPACLL
jgi:hypothetical protein